jgi:hypothetical protein
MVTRAAGNISGEATTPAGNIFPEAMRGIREVRRAVIGHDELDAHAVLAEVRDTMLNRVGLDQHLCAEDPDRRPRRRAVDCYPGPVRIRSISARTISLTTSYILRRALHPSSRAAFAAFPRLALRSLGR